MNKCEFCGKEYKGTHKNTIKRNLSAHILHCKLNPNYIKFKCKYCYFEDDNFGVVGSHVTNCILNPNYEKNKLKRIENGKIGRKHTDESKEKISKSRIQFLKENPNKVPYLLNHSRNESYPEKYFTELFNKESIEIESKFRIGLYELDFCILDKKIDIEIDGNQHYLDKKIVESDIKRNKFLEDNGWDIIRINWSNYNSMTFKEKSDYISNLKKYINNLITEKPTINFLRIKRGCNLCVCGGLKSIKSKNCKNCPSKDKIKKQYNSTTKRYDKKDTCLICGEDCSYGYKNCDKCSKIKRRKTVRPLYEVLIKEVNDIGYRAVGRKYNVSDTAIRKWIKNYEKAS